MKVMPKAWALKDVEDVGYCTTVKYLVGRTPAEMEHLLGLRQGSKLHNGANVYRVDPLPSPEQFELRGYTNTPDGVAQINGKQLHDDYPPGWGVPQWKLLGYPQSLLKKLAIVEPQQRFACIIKDLPTAICAFMSGR